MTDDWEDVLDVDDRPRCEADHAGGVCQAVLLPDGRCPRREHAP